MKAITIALFAFCLLPCYANASLLSDLTNGIGGLFSNVIDTVFQIPKDLLSLLSGSTQAAENGDFYKLDQYLGGIVLNLDSELKEGGTETVQKTLINLSTLFNDMASSLNGQNSRQITGVFYQVSKILNILRPYIPNAQLQGQLDNINVNIQYLLQSRGAGRAGLAQIKQFLGNASIILKQIAISLKQTVTVDISLSSLISLFGKLDVALSVNSNVNAATVIDTLQQILVQFKGLAVKLPSGYAKSTFSSIISDLTTSISQYSSGGFSVDYLRAFSANAQNGLKQALVQVVALGLNSLQTAADNSDSSVINGAIQNLLDVFNALEQLIPNGPTHENISILITQLTQMTKNSSPSKSDITAFIAAARSTMQPMYINIIMGYFRTLQGGVNSGDVNFVNTILSQILVMFQNLITTVSDDSPSYQIFQGIVSQITDLQKNLSSSTLPSVNVFITSVQNSLAQVALQGFLDLIGNLKVVASNGDVSSISKILIQMLSVCNNMLSVFPDGPTRDIISGITTQINTLIGNISSQSFDTNSITIFINSVENNLQGFFIQSLTNLFNMLKINLSQSGSTSQISTILQQILFVFNGLATVKTDDNQTDNISTIISQLTELITNFSNGNADSGDVTIFLNNAQNGLTQFLVQGLNGLFDNLMDVVSGGDSEKVTYTLNIILNYFNGLLSLTPDGQQHDTLSNIITQISTLITNLSNGKADLSGVTNVVINVQNNFQQSFVQGITSLITNLQEAIKNGASNGQITLILQQISNMFGSLQVLVPSDQSASVSSIITQLKTLIENVSSGTAGLENEDMTPTLKQIWVTVRQLQQDMNQIKIQVNEERALRSYLQQLLMGHLEGLSSAKNC